MVFKKNCKSKEDVLNFVNFIVNNKEIKVKNKKFQKNIDKIKIQLDFDDASNIFYKNDKFIDLSFFIFDCLKVININKIFAFCKKLKAAPEFINTKNIKTAHDAFFRCFNLQEIPNFDMSGIIDGRQMFDNCRSIKEIKNIDLSNLKYASKMFINCENLKAIKNLKLQNLIDASNMFASCKNLIQMTKLDFSKVKHCYRVFANTFIKHVPYLNTKSAENMESMFEDNENLQLVDGLDFSKTTTVKGIFKGCINLKKIKNIEKFNFKNIKTTDMFYAYSETDTEMIQKYGENGEKLPGKHNILKFLNKK